jgi:hypothetical protein
MNLSNETINEMLDELEEQVAFGAGEGRNRFAELFESRADGIMREIGVTGKTDYAILAYMCSTTFQPFIEVRDVIVYNAKDQFVVDLYGKQRLCHRLSTDFKCEP